MPEQLPLVRVIFRNRKQAVLARDAVRFYYSMLSGHFGRISETVPAEGVRIPSWKRRVAGRLERALACLYSFPSSKEKKKARALGNFLGFPHGRTVMPQSDLHLLARALDLYSRVLCGQMHEISNVLSVRGGDSLNCRIRHETETLWLALKALLTGLAGYESYGLGHEKTPDSTVRGYMMYQQIRKFLNPDGRFDTDFLGHRIKDRPLLFEFLEGV